MKRILILEDDIIQLNALAEAIANAYPNWEVCKAPNFCEAISLLLDSLQHNNHFALFLLDVQLSSKDDTRTGFDFAANIRQHPEYYTTPLLFLTAVQDNNYSALSKYHCYNYILKPYSEVDILQHLQQMQLTGYLKEETLTLYDTDRVKHYIPIQNLIYIQSSGHTLTYFTKAGKYSSRTYTITSIVPYLPGNFIQCHKSYIVNLEYIVSYDNLNRMLHVTGASNSIPVSRILKDHPAFSKLLH